MQQSQQGGSAPFGELIGGTFRVDPERPLPDAGAGLPAFAARDVSSAREDRMALQVRRRAPPRPLPLTALPGLTIPGLLSTHAHGVGVGLGGAREVFVVCDAPPGPPLGARGTVARRWTEGELLACVLRPIGGALAALQRLRLTHRAIRPDNVFQPRPGQPVVLGPAWAAPPASLQPASFEAPYAACCLPEGRGDGSIADDVHALAVLILALAAGQMPLAGLDDAEVVRRKLTLGSFVALTTGLPVSHTVAELVRGMLADDPEHRPSPAQLQDPEAIRGRRLASRPARIATRPLEVAGQTVRHARALAGALAAAPGAAVETLRAGHVDRWLRRTLGEPTLAGLVEEAVRARAADAAPPQVADGVLLARTVALIDPLAPLVWRGLALWPDGLGPALAAATPEQASELAALVDSEVLAAWAAARPGRCDAAMLRALARDWRVLRARPDWGGGTAVLRAQLNPLERCASPLLATPVVRPVDLLPALDRLAASASRPPLPVDRDIAAYLAGRAELGVGREAAAVTPGDAPSALAQLRLLARLESRLRAAPTPALAAWLAGALQPSLAGRRGTARRARVEAAMRAQAAAGVLSGLLLVLDDPAESEAEASEAAAAEAALARIEAELQALEDARAGRRARAERAGQEVATALAVIAVAVVAAALVF